MDLSTYLIVAIVSLLAVGVVAIVSAKSAFARLSNLASEREEALKREIAKNARYERTITDRTLELKRCNSEFEQFAYIASHDLQEPLRTVASYTQLLAQKYRGQLDERADKYVHYAADGAQRMQRMVEALLSFSRVGTRGRAPEPTDLALAARTALANLGPAIASSGARVEIGALPTAMADSTQLTHVFEHLIDNAIKFRGDGRPHIRVTAEPMEDHWAIRVVDNGIGIETKYAERVFQLFQRLHDRERYEGSGMGLTISRKIVERHGGRIWYESQLGLGTTFFFTLPAASHQKAA
jgi:light-regulated signal transduction histidine kinase (bacteriophytochrome)